MVFSDNNGTPDFANATSYAVACFVECFADWDRNRTINTMDLTAFLNDWNAAHPDADLNGDGVINTQDMTVFLGAYAAGDCICPEG
ncbi:hypothetical protein MNBD_PLANCTO03-772 [hydrothermal vent metagenome]|uniref:EF-hand domain-containing protein n=1 Tax=hydrothermal vent metagenome TaxID=652676 RepID=A0A3B1DJP7_9ZZZZ